MRKVFLLSLFLLSSCSLELIPVHYSKINTAKLAEQPALRGPEAPGAFKYSWKFVDPRGVRRDSTEVEIADGVVRPAPSPAQKSERAVVFETVFGPQFNALNSLQEVTGPRHQGRVAYQLSPNASAWYYHDGKHWKPAPASHRTANSAEEITRSMGSFASEISTGSLLLKVFLVAPDQEHRPELKEIIVQGVAPRTDGW